MTGRALQRRNALALRTAHHVEEVAMSVIALLRIVAISVAVDAAWMRHHRINLLPCGQTFSSGGTRSCVGGLLVTRCRSRKRCNREQNCEEDRSYWTQHTDLLRQLILSLKKRRYVGVTMGAAYRRGRSHQSARYRTGPLPK